MNSNEIEKSIRDWLIHGRYSKLTFLENEWQNAEQKFYIGYFYFVQDIKKEENDYIFDEIVKREGSKANAFIFLGKIANKIYDTRIPNSASISFFRKALEEDNLNSEAHWLVYERAYSLDNLLQSLKIDLENNDFEKINSKGNNIRRLDDFNKLTEDELIFLKNLFSKNEGGISDKIRSVLCKIHFLLSEYEQGLNYINISDKVDLNTIKDYYDKNLILIDQAISKVHSFQIEKFIHNNEDEIYKIVTEKLKANPEKISKETLIKRAYLAKKYNEVVEVFELAKDNKERLHNIDTYLYYLLSQQELKLIINKDALKYVNSRFNFLNEFDQIKSNNLLYYILLFNIEVNQIEKEVLSNNFLNFPLESFVSYKKAEKILEFPEILNSNYYEKFRVKLDELKSTVHKNNKNNRLISYEENYDFDCIEQDLLVDYCSLCIEFEKVEKATQFLENYHARNSPTMSTYNTLGVCYQRNGELKKAFDCFKKSYLLMKACKEIDYTIIQNYLDCSKYLDDFIFSDDEYNKLKQELNIGLTNVFKWSDSYANGTNTLFKYSPFNINSIDALSNQYFFLPSKKQLNDPIELPDLKKLNAENHILDKYYICSFSTNENSMLMWSHYAQQHEGIMVEYFFAGELPYGFGIGKVSYDEDVKRLKDKDLYIFNQFLLTKNKDWSYENEIRLFTTLNQKVEFSFYDFPNPDRSKINASIRSITLGLNFPNDKKKLLRNLISLLNLNRSTYEPKIIVKQAFLCEENNYSLIYKEIDLG